MQLFSNYNFNSITTSEVALNELVLHIHLLIGFIDECGDRLTQQEFNNLATNIAWLKRFYEATERCLLNDH
jgi:hypothetical protein